MHAISASALRVAMAAGALIAATVAMRPAHVVAHVEPWHHDRPTLDVLILTLAIHGDARCREGFARRISDRRVGDRLRNVIDAGTLPTRREGSHPLLFGSCESSGDSRYWECGVHAFSVDVDGPFGDDVLVRIRTSDGSADLDTVSC